MNTLLTVAASFFGAALTAMGMGGGGIFLIYLTAFLGFDQLKAQGINLVFFVPIAAVALIFHVRNKLVRFKIAVPCVLLGLPGVFLGEYLAKLAGPELLRKIFGGFLLIIGIKELLSKKQPKKLENKA